MVFIYSTVRKYEDVCAVTECLVNLHEETVDRSLQFRTLIIESRYTVDLIEELREKEGA